ncbi:MAG: hypothetical protein V4684_19575 [Pseudomonadota bacterium]
MTYRLIAGPEAMAVSLADARIAARADGSDLDTAIEIQVRTITEEVEHLTGRAIINQTYRVTLDEFPDAIRLPAPPVISVTSLKYLDQDGVEQTLHPDDYVLDNVSEPGYIAPAPGLGWPPTADRINAVNVVVVCGYGPTDATTPATLKGYILAKVQEHFAPDGTKESPHLVRLLDRYGV